MLCSTYDVIAGKIVSMGFNCVRLTWPLYLVTDQSLGSMTVRQSLHKFGLFEAVETNSDEVYAKVSLLTCPPEVEILFPNDNNEQNIKYFTKVLTASDISPHGDFILFKKDAIECLPPLDMSQLTPSQEIVAKDLHDHVWKFKHTFRGTPKKHFFTSGWKEFVRGKSLAVGDSFVFLRGENGESRVGIRKAAHQQSDMSSSVISKESMHHGFIASASNAIHTKCMFDVFYKPKSSKFIVNCDKFLDAVTRKFNTSSRFTMKFEGHDFNEITWEELEGFRVGGELELRIVESRRGVLPGLKTAVPYDYIDVSSGSGWDQVLKKAEEELRNEN
ncbi:hypothetical protein F2Q68_00018677 [Brassica cretica]|uniref:TF-B3 domain-containing protein n=1 Tax=Brassica cretica TaxID=69181 RepID=A0A8S9G0I4_BRACR|nr:hypothetical protein F2Q68_00018677 [Brassica cretica]